MKHRMNSKDMVYWTIIWHRNCICNLIWTSFFRFFCFIYDFVFCILWQRCVYAPVRFRYKKHLVWTKENITFLHKESRSQDPPVLVAILAQGRTGKDINSRAPCDSLYPQTGQVIKTLEEKKDIPSSFFAVRETAPWGQRKWCLCQGCVSVWWSTWHVCTADHTTALWQRTHTNILL